MVGALIIRGDRLPEIDAHGGDIDTLLKNRDGSAITERVLVLQQIQYACLDAKGAIKVEKDGAGDVIAWVCDPGDTGGIEFYDDPGGNGLCGPGTRGQSGRCGLTSIGSSRTIAVDCRCTETLPAASGFGKNTRPAAWRSELLQTEDHRRGDGVVRWHRGCRPNESLPRQGRRPRRHCPAARFCAPQRGWFLTRCWRKPDSNHRSLSYDQTEWLEKGARALCAWSAEMHAHP
jgi:hypothetical protein